MTVYDKIRNKQGQARNLGYNPKIAFVSENNFWNLCAELDLGFWRPDHGAKVLSEKTKAYTLFGMNVYVSDDMPEDEIYIGYHPVEFLLGAS